MDRNSLLTEGQRWQWSKGLWEYSPMTYFSGRYASASDRILSVAFWCVYNIRRCRRPPRAFPIVRRVWLSRSPSSLSQNPSLWFSDRWFSTRYHLFSTQHVLRAIWPLRVRWPGSRRWRFHSIQIQSSRQWRLHYSEHSNDTGVNDATILCFVDLEKRVNGIKRSSVGSLFTHFDTVVLHLHHDGSVRRFHCPQYCRHWHCCFHLWTWDSRLQFVSPRMLRDVSQLTQQLAVAVLVW